VYLPAPDNTTAFAIARYNPDGSTDYTFGNDGLVTTVIEDSSSLTDLLLQPDGKIVAAGSSASAGVPKSHFALARYNPDGSADVTFGSQGEVVMDFPGQANYLKAIALTADGRLVAGGDADGTGVLARLTQIGTPDPTFGVNGQLVLTGTEKVSGLAALPGDKIATGGSFQQSPGDYAFVARRYLSTGAPDISFSGDGVATVLVSSRGAYVSKLLVDGDGKLVLVGAAYGEDEADVGAVRFDANGNLETSFGSNGLARSDLPPYHTDVWSAAFTPDGGIVTCGVVRYDTGVVKFTSSGAVATSFGSSGLATLRGTLASSNSAAAIALQPDGKIVALGSFDKNDCEGCVRKDVGLVRYNGDGSVDKTFGANGVVTLDFLDNSWDEAVDVVVQPDGKIILGGYYYESGGQTRYLVLVRLDPDGSVDETFGVGGTATRSFPQGTPTLASLALQPGGKIIAAGTLRRPENSDFLLMRYLVDGTPDNDFGSGGVVLTDFGASYEGAEAVAVAGNDWIIAAGSTSSYTVGMTNTKVNFALARYTMAGVLDPSFGVGGKMVSDYQGQDNTVAAMTLDAQGRILVAGSTGAYSQELQDNVTDFALARYTRDGLLDLSFGTAGWRVTDFGEINESATSLVATGDGKITSVGYTGYRKTAPVYNGTLDSFAFDIALTRHDTTGGPDATFGPGGKVRMDFGGGEALNAAVLDGEQRLVAGGWLQFPLYTEPDFLLMRFGEGTVPATTATAVNTTVPASTVLPTGTATPTIAASPTNTASATSTVEVAGTATPGSTATSTRTPVASNTVTPTRTPVASSTACPVEFSDVPASEPFYSFIRCLACRGVMSGYADNTFRPGNKITRAQLAKIVGNASGIVEAGGPQRFQDVPNSGGTESFYSQINGLAAAGVMSGYGCGGDGEPCVGPSDLPYFRPGANATRGQIAKIVANAAKLESTVSGQTFTDVPRDSTFYEYVQRLTSMNVMSGYPCEGTNPQTGQPEPCDAEGRAYFRPSNNATRGQVSKIVANTFYPGCQTPAGK
jgi:uncharacterized delta-60 repeat protein